MELTEKIAQELNILSLFNQATYQEGLKVHTNDASTDDIAAIKRLFDKGLVTQVDGGYLTTLGKDASEHLQDLLLILK
jgi:uncharacterized protein (TIGR02647 family)